VEARLQAVAATLEDWLNSFGKLAERKDLRQAELPHFPADEFLSNCPENSSSGQAQTYLRRHAARETALGTVTFDRYDR
jgi:hypothetical protein